MFGIYRSVHGEEEKMGKKGIRKHWVGFRSMISFLDVTGCMVVWLCVGEKQSNSGFPPKD